MSQSRYNIVLTLTKMMLNLRLYSEDEWLRIDEIRYIDMWDYDGRH